MSARKTNPFEIVIRTAQEGCVIQQNKIELPDKEPRKEEIDQIFNTIPRERLVIALIHSGLIVIEGTQVFVWEEPKTWKTLLDKPYDILTWSGWKNYLSWPLTPSVAVKYRKVVDLLDRIEVGGEEQKMN